MSIKTLEVVRGKLFELTLKTPFEGSNMVALVTFDNGWFQWEAPVIRFAGSIPYGIPCSPEAKYADWYPIMGGPKDAGIPKYLVKSSARYELNKLISKLVMKHAEELGLNRPKATTAPAQATVPAKRKTQDEESEELFA